MTTTTTTTTTNKYRLNVFKSNKNQTETASNRAEDDASSRLPSQFLIQQYNTQPNFATSGTPVRNPKQAATSDDDFLFRKPIIFECKLCAKIFYNNAVYKKHIAKRNGCSVPTQEMNSKHNFMRYFALQDA